MFPPPLLETRSAAQQLLLPTLPALVAGIVVGIALDLSALLYVVLVIIAVAGGIAAGFEHATAGEGAERGLVTGLLFGAGVIAGHHLLGRTAKVSLPHPELAELLVASLATAVLSSIGGALRARYERTHAEAAGV